jgi:predicted NBD/HSP70 family sugar kinase
MGDEQAAIAPVTGSAADLSRGSNQVGVRLYNERLVLSLIRRHGSLPKAEIARLTGLSAQTISVIVRQLAADGFLLRDKPQRGKVGQPSVPFRLNPSAAFALGLKIGRRSADLVLVDFLAQPRGSRRVIYRYPVPEEILAFAGEAAATLTRGLPTEGAARLAGLGIAAPFELWSWREEMGAPDGVAARWRDLDIGAELTARLPWPVHLCNDATAACGAELLLGQGDRFETFLYLYVGSFVGGGVVIRRSLFAGRTGNAGALGSMLVSDPGGRPEQLIRRASLYVLERRLAAAGADPSRLWLSPDDWDDWPEILDGWLAEAAAALAQAIVCALAVIDFDGVIVDGACPAEVRTRLVDAIREAFSRLDRQGLSPTEIVAGTLGSRARALGAACLPLLANFAQDRELLFKNGA